MAQKIAIVTGASSGMGMEFALRLDARRDFDAFWLVARRRPQLTALQDRLSHPAEIFTCDLSERDCMQEIRARLERERPDVRILVNGAGYGKFGAFEQIGEEDNLGMIDLNCRAPTALISACLPYMHAGAKICNIASMASFEPIPHIAVYAATKAYVLSFSRALHREEKARGISVTALCPYWVKTAFLSKAQGEGKPIRRFRPLYESEFVVKRGIAAMDRGREVCVPGFVAKATHALTKLLPHSLVMSVWLRQQRLS